MNVTFSHEFVHLADSLSLKILYGVSLIFGQIISFICNFVFFHFEYYGGDPMKRSIKNYLLAQIFLMLIFFNIMWLGFAGRILIGTLNEDIAVVVIFLRQFSVIYIVLCFSEIIVCDVLMLFGWKHFCFIDEIFLHHVLLIFDIGFSFGTQLSRWMLGGFKTKDFEFLTGTSMIIENSCFWQIFLTINCSIILIGCLALSIKKYKVVYKANQYIFQNIHIGIEDQNAENSDGSANCITKFNNQKYNLSMANSLEIGVIFLLLTYLLYYLFGYTWDGQPKTIMDP